MTPDAATWAPLIRRFVGSAIARIMRPVEPGVGRRPGGPAARPPAPRRAGSRRRAGPPRPGAGATPARLPARPRPGRRRAAPGRGPADDELSGIAGQHLAPGLGDPGRLAEGH